MGLGQGGPKTGEALRKRRVKKIPFVADQFLRASQLPGEDFQGGKIVEINEDLHPNSEFRREEADHCPFE